jgi:hypothetical protein
LRRTRRSAVRWTSTNARIHWRSTAASNPSTCSPPSEPPGLVVAHSTSTGARGALNRLEKRHITKMRIQRCEVESASTSVGCSSISQSRVVCNGCRRRLPASSVRYRERHRAPLERRAAA